MEWDMRSIGDFYILFKYTLIYLKNFYKRHYLYAPLTTILNFFFLFSVLGYSYLIVESSYLITFNSFKYFSTNKFNELTNIFLLFNSIHFLFYHVLGSLFVIIVLKFFSNKVNGISHLPLSKVTTRVLSLMNLLIINVVNVPILISLFWLGVPSNLNLSIWIALIVVLLLIFNYIFFVYTMYLCQKIAKQLHLNFAKVFLSLSLLITAYYFFSMDRNYFSSSITVISLWDTFGDAIGIVIPTLWLMNLLYGFYITDLKIIIFNLFYISVLFLAAIALENKMSAKKQLKIDFYDELHVNYKCIKAEIPIKLEYPEHSPLTALIIRECMNYNSYLMIIMGNIVVSLMAACYFKNFELPGLNTIIIISLFCNVTHNEWPLIVYLKSFPLKNNTIYIIKSIFSLIFNLFFIFIGFIMSYYFYDKNYINRIPEFLLLSATLIWLKQLVIDLCFFFVNAKSNDFLNLSINESIKFAVINISYYSLMGFLFHFYDNYQKAEYSFAYWVVFSFVITHLLIHVIALKRFKKGDFGIY